MRKFICTVTLARAVKLAATLRKDFRARVTTEKFGTRRMAVYVDDHHTDATIRQMRMLAA